MRIYQLIKLTGWTLEQIEDAPTNLCDWLLQIDVVFEEVKREREAKEREQLMGGGRR